MNSQLTSQEYKEALQLITEYAQTNMLLLDYRQKQLLKRYFQEYINNKN